jgi:hypothetical protein
MTSRPPPDDSSDHSADPEVGESALTDALPGFGERAEEAKQPAASLQQDGLEPEYARQCLP